MSDNLTRRQFLKSSALATGALLLPAVTETAAADDIRKIPLHKKLGEARTICPYCSCGCGLLVATDERGHITNVEGDPDNPVNRGLLCPKGVSVNQLSNSPLRLGKVRYRAPGATEFEEKSWDWAIEQIAQRIKTTRDESFVRTVPVGDKNVPVNRTEALAFIGGAANNTEDCYLATKFARTLGIVYLEHQARL